MARIYALFVVNMEGIALFSRNLAPEKVHPDLVTSFLTAIRELVKEISPSSEPALRTIEARGFTIITETGEKVLGALLLDREDPLARECLRVMVKEFERRFGHMLDTWDGDITLFEPFGEICDKVLSVIALASYHVPKLGGWAEGDIRVPRDLWAVMRHVDGRKTVAEIAREAGLSLREAIDRVKKLAELGLVEVDVHEPVRLVIKAYEEVLTGYLRLLRELVGYDIATKLVEEALEAWGHGWLAYDDVLSARDADRLAWLYQPKEVAEMCEGLLSLLGQKARPLLGDLVGALRALASKKLAKYRGDLERFEAIGG